MKPSSQPQQQDAAAPRDRRVSFFEKTHVRQVVYRKSMSGQQKDSSQIADGKFSIPDISTDDSSSSSGSRRKSGSIFGLNFDQEDNTETQSHKADESIMNEVSTSFEQESFEIPTKGAVDGSSIHLAEGEVELHQIPVVNDAISQDADSSMIQMGDSSMDSNECGVDSPTGSEILKIQSAFMSMTPIKNPTPLRQSFTVDKGWTLDSLQNLDDGTVDMDLTEPVNGVLQVNHRRSSVAPGRYSTASAMDITQVYGDILNVNESAESTVIKNGKVDTEMTQSPVRKSPRWKAGSSRPSNVGRYSTASAMDVTQSYGHILDVASSASDFESCSSSPVRKVSGSKSGASSSRLSTPKNTGRTSSSRLSTPKAVSSSTPARSSPRLQTKPKLPQKGSNTSNSSGVSNEQSDLFMSSQVSNVDVKLGLPATLDASRRSLGGIEEDWIENTSFNEPDFDMTRTLPPVSQAAPVASSQRSAKSSVQNTPRQKSCSSSNFEDSDVGRISIVNTPMKVSSNQLSSAFAKYLDDEVVPLVAIPSFEPSIVDEHSKMEIESCEKLISEWNYLLDRDAKMVDMMIEDLTRSSDLLFANFENDYDGFLSMLEVAHKDSTLDSMQEILDTRLQMNDVLHQTMQEYSNVLTENVKSRNDCIVNDDLYLHSVAELLNTKQMDLQKLMMRFNEVNALTADEYKEAVMFCGNIEDATRQAEDKADSIQSEIQQLDQKFAEVIMSLENGKSVKSQIKLEFDDVPESSNDWSDAREFYDLLSKVSCWSIKSIDSDNLKLTYREGVAEVTLTQDGELVQVASNCFSKNQIESLKRMPWNAFWNSLDGALTAL